MLDVGPRPPGDPEAMRRYAMGLRVTAQTIGGAGKGAADAVDAATFVGTAGNNTRFRAGRLRTRSTQCAGNLTALANLIALRAGGVERAQEDWQASRDLVEQQIRKQAD